MFQRGMKAKVRSGRHVIIDGTFAVAIRADGPRVLAGDDPDFDHG